ncbi:hypothetical protein I3760_14G025200 [Carya illinoinensis]|nr:hypothetical protein I3760_14G025200 [Carya illinoinensis]KAG2669234.1 hypothetical protein I3760_14G025200 [Carya illinoinensis]KAG2669235.1 hypothetical protein I3760_14G025200 [Carya illinoinensis]KAG2669236.1 hypothetical protein I3760_14G025200 [Carya illinoinensis]
MERTLIYPAIHPTDEPNDEKKLLACKGLVINIADHSSKTKRKFESCKELIIDIIDTDPPALEALEASRCPDKYCIYRVPKRLRKVNNMAYTPRLVSIGPFHHRSEELKDMDIKKFLILKNFCNRTGKSIKDLKCIIKDKENKIRSCYSETFLLSSDGFVNMILLDAIFILELFCRKYEKLMAHGKDSENSKAREIDYILSRPYLERGILHDLLLLENQLPFFILKKLYQNVENDTKPTLLELSCGFFVDLYNYIDPKNDEVDHIDKWKHITKLVNNHFVPTKSNKVKHFTDLVRYFFCLTNTEKSCRDLVRSFGCPQKKNKRNNKHLDGTATKLDETGLKLTKPDSERELLQIQFPENVCLETFPCFNLSWLLSCLPFLKSIDCLERRVQPRLEVPPLLLDDKTEGLFRNLMALEQCHYPLETDICDYIVLLDDLITTKEDVRLLVEKKIIVNELGSSAAVTKLVNNLALEIEESGTHYANLCEKVNDYYRSPWNRLVGTLTRVYFSDFFKGTATVVGIIVLFLTLWNFQRLIRLSTGRY